TSHTGSTQQPYQYVGQLGYYTHYQDPNMGSLMQLGVRFYDPALGRFTQRDPIRHGENHYLYSLDNPLSYVDPSGYVSQDDVNKVWKCVAKCAGNTGDDWKRCFMKCMGNKFGNDLCIYVFCALFPGHDLCKPENHCYRDQEDPVNCQNCCDIKHICCMIRQGWQTLGEAACNKGRTICKGLILPRFRGHPKPPVSPRSGSHNPPGTDTPDWNAAAHDCRRPRCTQRCPAWPLPASCTSGDAQVPSSVCQRSSPLGRYPSSFPFGSCSSASRNL
ncbi:MAG: RHS repeat-associated core domain-containing protein, partial [Candidatus Krumholzibacteria bacterium]|nr:RHS repeat-associated core domain-containing protein [Candidatus Krumholzibacteria bacterium]